jgi:hypothetical protein
MKITISWDIASLHILPASRINLFPQTEPCTQLFVAIGSPTNPCESSEPMGTGQHPFLLPSAPYITVIPSQSSFCLATCSRLFLARLIFDPEDGGDTFLRNVGSYTDYTALYPRRWQFSEVQRFTARPVSSVIVVTDDVFTVRVS